MLEFFLQISEWGPSVSGTNMPVLRSGLVFSGLVLWSSVLIYVLHSEVQLVEMKGVNITISPATSEI